MSSEQKTVFTCSKVYVGKCIPIKYQVLPTRITAEKAAWRSAFLTIQHYILNVNSTKTHSSRDTLKLFRWVININNVFNSNSDNEQQLISIEKCERHMVQFNIPSYLPLSY